MYDVMVPAPDEETIRLATAAVQRLIDAAARKFRRQEARKDGRPGKPVPVLVPRVVAFDWNLEPLSPEMKFLSVPVYGYDIEGD